MNRLPPYKEREDNYFVFMHSKKWTLARVIDSLERGEIEDLVECYLHGRKKTAIKGHTVEISNLTIFRVFQLSPLANSSKIKEDFNRLTEGVFTLFKPIEYFTNNSLLFQEVTKQFIGNKLWGEDSKRKSDLLKSHFIDFTRIKELETTKVEGFDLSKLIRLCKEVNSSYAHGNFYAVGMLCRAIKDHVPPIFGHRNVNEIIQDGSISKSDRDSLRTLHDNKHIQDSFLHSHIKKKEALATASSVEYRPQVDVLLRMIIEKGEK